MIIDELEKLRRQLVFDPDNTVLNKRIEALEQAMGMDIAMFIPRSEDRQKNKTLQKIWDITRKKFIVSIIDEGWDYLINLGVNLNNILGCGRHGCVFSTDKRDIIAKVTGEPNEIDFQKLVLNNDYEGFPEIYRIEKIRHTDFYVIFRKEIKLIYDESNIPEKDFDSLRYFITNYNMFLSGKIKSYPKQSNNRVKPLSETIESIYNDGVTIYDVNEGNIGISKKDGRFVLYDAWLE